MNPRRKFNQLKQQHSIFQPPVNKLISLFYTDTHRDWIIYACSNAYTPHSYLRSREMCFDFQDHTGYENGHGRQIDLTYCSKHNKQKHTYLWDICSSACSWHKANEMWSLRETLEISDILRAMRFVPLRYLWNYEIFIFSLSEVNGSLLPRVTSRLLVFWPLLG